MRAWNETFSRQYGLSALCKGACFLIVIKEILAVKLHIWTYPRSRKALLHKMDAYGGTEG